jgi:REP-associated tyrosine transposase
MSGLFLSCRRSSLKGRTSSNCPSPARGSGALPEEMSDPPDTVRIMKQLNLDLRTWGGKRRGAGRKRINPRRCVPHRPRPRFRWKPLHVTIRVRREVWNLRTHRCFRALKRSFAKGCARFGFRLVHFSVQGNHLHLVVEAPDHVQLGRAMKGLEVRMARALNKVMRRKGQVFADRYHARLLHWPREVRFAIDYVLHNRALHALREGWPSPPPTATRSPQKACAATILRSSPSPASGSCAPLLKRASPSAAAAPSPSSCPESRRARSAPAPRPARPSRCAHPARKASHRLPAAPRPARRPPRS